MKQKQSLRTGCWPPIPIFPLPFPFFPCPQSCAQGTQLLEILCLALSRDCKQKHLLHQKQQCYGDSSLICPARVSVPSYSYRTPHSSSSCTWEGTRLMLLPDPHLLSQQASMTTLIWRACPAGSTARDFQLSGFFLVCLFCRPSSKLSSRSSQGVQSPIQKHPGFGCDLCAEFRSSGKAPSPGKQDTWQLVHLS